ncbi:type VII toxin-antitoxin system HepT family RNase toxin [Haloarchaeobius litoreus]|uniref:DUF86 domain-containing protein n=1 Tax=Haloarchaeobius litoreus TaxID=755306 RepID=A0ABD6DNT1_9EURY|nr:DUF86 domain-containing protein [Haloarchaeobius litoreus]
MRDEGFPQDKLNRILTAIETLETSLGVLAEKQSVSRDTYDQDSDTRDIVERRFVKMTEACIDIGEELVKHHQGEPPKSNPATMRELEDIGILPSTVAEEMAQAARFRNVLSHTYGDIIDNHVVYNALQDLERYRLFAEYVGTHLDSIGALDEADAE